MTGRINGSTTRLTGLWWGWCDVGRLRREIALLVAALWTISYIDAAIRGSFVGFGMATPVMLAAAAWLWGTRNGTK